MRVKSNKVYLYNSSLEYVQTAKSWSEAAKISGAVSYRIVYKYLDSGELFENNWYFFSKEFSAERITELKANTDAENIPTAIFLNTSCKIVERYLDSNKRFKENNYLIRSKPIKDAEAESDPNPDPESKSTSNSPLSELPETSICFKSLHKCISNSRNIWSNG
ncbi:3283_t:CDS:2 [Rhizophagus irregularis]|nr:3283_t:CDS:2 [Rhizophagus irregularis]